MARKKKKSKKSSKKAGAASRRINLAWRNFVTFLLIFIFSYVLYSFSTTELFQNFFGIFFIITGFMALAFLIVFFVLIVIKKSKEKGKRKKKSKKNK